MIEAENLPNGDPHPFGGESDPYIVIRSIFIIFFIIQRQHMLSSFLFQAGLQIRWIFNRVQIYKKFARQDLKKMQNFTRPKKMSSL